MFLKKFCKKSKHVLPSTNFFSPEIRAINEIMGKKQKCNFAFPLQQWLRERAIISC
jgi:hypothetical protein